MYSSLIEYIVIFITVFASISLLRLILNFSRALLSNPPTKFVLEFSALLYYGICVSYLITLIIIKTI
jgi:hypothetical protein